jgi:hypothetical protein
MNDRRQPAEVNRSGRRGRLKSRLGAVIVRRQKAGENSAQREQPDHEPTKDRNAIGASPGESHG